MHFNAVLEEEVIQLTQLMNILAFGVSKGLMDSTSIEKFDANYISVYCPRDECFSYFVQRLCGLAIEDDANPELSKHLWYVYINNKLHDWN